MLASPCGASSLSTDAWKLNHQPSQHLAIFGPHTRHHANAVWRTIHKSGIQRNEAPCRSEAQLSVDNKMSLPCTTMETSSMLKNSVKMVFHLCSISCLENNVVTMTFQTSPERTNNRNNKTKSHNFNCWNEEETIRVMLNYIILTPTEHSSKVAIFPSTPPPIIIYSWLHGATFCKLSVPTSRGNLILLDIPKNIKLLSLPWSQKWSFQEYCGSGQIIQN